jgi:transcriptional antiterminator NusG
MNFESVNEADRPTDALQGEGNTGTDTSLTSQASPQPETASAPEVTRIEQRVEPVADASSAPEAEALPIASRVESQPIATSEALAGSESLTTSAVDTNARVEQQDVVPDESPTLAASLDEPQAASPEESAEHVLPEETPQPQVQVTEVASSGEAEEEELIIRPPKRRSKAAKSDKPKAPRKSAKKAEKLPDPGDGTGYEAPYVPEGVESLDEPQWYAIHCYSGYENKVKHNLEQRIETMGMADKIFEVVVPTEDEIEVRDGKRRTVERRVFPGYVMVRMKMSEDSWHVVRNTPGVTRFVGMGNRPQPLSPQEVNQILRRMEAEAPKIKVNFRVGQKVRITDGPFADFMGLVDKIDTERAKVTVLVSFFGRETPVELDFLQVEKM